MADSKNKKAKAKNMSREERSKRADAGKLMRRATCVSPHYATVWAGDKADSWL
jgi:hypothetical protein